MGIVGGGPWVRVRCARSGPESTRGKRPAHKDAARRETFGRNWMCAVRRPAHNEEDAARREPRPPHDLTRNAGWYVLYEYARMARVRIEVRRLYGVGGRGLGWILRGEAGRLYMFLPNEPRIREEPNCVNSAYGMICET